MPAFFGNRTVTNIAVHLNITPIITYTTPRQLGFDPFMTLRCKKDNKKHFTIDFDCSASLPWLLNNCFLTLRCVGGNAFKGGGVIWELLGYPLTPSRHDFLSVLNLFIFW